MTYNDIVRRLTSVYGQREARAMTRILIEDTTGLSYTDMLCGAVDSLPPSETLRIEEAVKRLERHEPLQYVTSVATFHGHRLMVRPGVLIPRPETEWLVDTAITICSQATTICPQATTTCSPATASRPQAATPRILDIGTGSGCVAIGIKLALPHSYVEAWDISDTALDTAMRNAHMLNADITLRKRDALTATCDGETWDIIVSNPPYVCDSEKSSMESNVLDYEPHTALFVPDEDPLLFYRAIADYARQTLTDNGRLLLECNTRLVDDTAEMLCRHGFGHVSKADDCFGLPRFVMASR